MTGQLALVQNVLALPYKNVAWLKKSTTARALPVVAHGASSRQREQSRDIASAVSATTHAHTPAAHSVGQLAPVPFTAIHSSSA